MAEHTPGPWRADDVRYQRDFRTFVNVGEEPFGFIAAVSADPQHPETINANARLIAAAPELLEALINCADQAEIAMRAEGGEGFWAVEAARAAIAKATGKDA
jgi:hypothetical protein